MLKQLSHANLIVLFAVTALTVANCVLLEIVVSIPLVTLIGAGSFLVYQLDHGLPYSSEDQLNHPDRVQWIKDHRIYFYSSIVIALVSGLWAFTKIQTSVQAFVTCVALMSLCYVAPLLPRRTRLKDLPYTKLLLVLGCWALGGTLLPIIQAERPTVYTTTILLTGYRLFYLLPNLLIADWADRKGDRDAGIRTLAGSFSEKGIRASCILSLLLCLLCSMGFSHVYGPSKLLLIDGLGILGMGVLLAFPLTSWKGPLQLKLDTLACWPIFTVLGGLVFR